MFTLFVILIFYQYFSYPIRAYFPEFGDVYSFGRGRQGQGGNGTKSIKSCCSPQQVMPLQPERIVKVACGANHCLAVTVEGEVFQWGSMSRFLDNNTEFFGGLVQMPGMSAWNKTRNDLVRESHEAYVSFDFSFDYYFRINFG